MVTLSLGVIMNDWKAPIGGGGGGAGRKYGGPNGSAEKVDYSQLPLGGGSDDEGGGDDWIQRQIRGHKVSEGWGSRNGRLFSGRREQRAEEM